MAITRVLLRFFGENVRCKCFKNCEVFKDTDDYKDFLSIIIKKLTPIKWENNI